MPSKVSNVYGSVISKENRRESEKERATEITRVRQGMNTQDRRVLFRRRRYEPRMTSIVGTCRIYMTVSATNQRALPPTTAAVEATKGASKLLVLPRKFSRNTHNSAVAPDSAVHTPSRRSTPG